MMKFESDLVTGTTAPYGTPDLLDTWFDLNAPEFEEDWAHYFAEAHPS
jgi:hypothetical protein